MDILEGKIHVSGATFWYFMASFISASNKYKPRSVFCAMAHRFLSKDNKSLMRDMRLPYCCLRGCVRSDAGAGVL